MFNKTVERSIHDHFIEKKTMKISLIFKNFYEWSINKSFTKIYFCVSAFL